MKGVKIVFNICIFAALAVMAIIMCGYTLPPEAPDVNIVGSNLKRYECGTIPDGDSFTVTATPDGGSNYTLSYKWEYSETMNDRDWHDVAGATDTTCPIDKSLKVGSHYFRCTVTATRTADGETATAEALGIVDISRGPATYTLPNVNLEYGDTLGDKPLEGGWSWVDESINVGLPGNKTYEATYTPDDLYNYYPVTVSLDVTVTKRTVTVTALDQTIRAGEQISKNAAYIYCENLADGDALFSAKLLSDDDIIVPYNATFINTRTWREVTDLYNIIYKNGAVIVIPGDVGMDGSALPPGASANNNTAQTNETTSAAKTADKAADKTADNMKKSPQTGAPTEVIAVAVSAGVALAAAFGYKRKNEE